MKGSRGKRRASAVVAAVATAVLIAAVAVLLVDGGGDDADQAAAPVPLTTPPGHSGPTNGPELHVTLPPRPTSVGEMGDDSKAVVQVEVIGVGDGPDLPKQGPEGGPPPPPLDVDRVRMKVISRLAGSVPDEFTLSALNLPGAVEPDNKTFQPYKVGERYILFIQPRVPKDGTYVVTDADGRLRLDKQGEAQPLIEGPVGDRLEDKDKGEIKPILPGS